MLHEIERRAYRLYGLELASSLPLPFPAIDASGGEDATIDFVDCADAIAAAPIDVSPGLARIVVPGWARFEVRDGRHIRVEASIDATREAALFLLGAPLAALLYQRGIAVVRGGIATRGDRRVVLVGAGGSGVSTLLAALLEQGWRVQCDSLVAMHQAPDGSVAALPGLPVIKLWRDACERLGNGPDFDAPVRAGSSCHWVRLGVDERLNRPVTPTCVVALELWNRELLGETLSRRDGLERLLACRYHPCYAGADAIARQFRIFATLAGSIRIGRLCRPWRPFDPRAQVEPFFDLTDRLHDRTTG